jgi:hypothetical protein
MKYTSAADNDCKKAAAYHADNLSAGGDGLEIRQEDSL